MNKAVSNIHPSKRKAALLIAALATNGYSEIANAGTIGRGYEHLEEKLRALGALIRVV